MRTRIRMFLYTYYVRFLVNLYLSCIVVLIFFTCAPLKSTPEAYEAAYNFTLFTLIKIGCSNDSIIFIKNVFFPWLQL